MGDVNSEFIKNTDNKQKWLDVEKDHWRDMWDVSVILSCRIVKEKAEDRVSVGIFHIYRKLKSNGFRFLKKCFVNVHKL